MMKHSRKVAFLIIMSALPLRAEAQHKNLTMSGIVTDKVSRRPIEGARVTLVGSKANADTTTDSEGSFILTLAEGAVEGTLVRVRIEKLGYKPYDRLTSLSSAVPIQISLLSVGSVLAAPVAPSTIMKKTGFTTLVPFHGEWKNSPIPMNENLTDLHEEYYDDLGVIARRPDKQLEGWPVYKERRFESGDEQFAFVTRLVQFYIFKSVYSLERGIAGGLKWRQGVGVTPIDREAILTPDAVAYPSGALLEALSGNEFLTPLTRWMFTGKPLMLPIGTHVSFMEHSNPDKGEVFTCVMRLERPGHFKIDFEVQAGPGMNNQLPIGFSTATVLGTTTFTMKISMKYEIQRKKDRHFHADSYAAWADALFDGLRKEMGFDPALQSAPPISRPLGSSVVIDQLAQFIDEGSAIQQTFIDKNDTNLLISQEKAWADQVEHYLQNIVGKSYAIQFRNAHGTAWMGMPVGHSVVGGGVWQEIQGKNDMMNNFISELRHADKTEVNTSGGINISGGVVNNPTVNNFAQTAKPPRRIKPENRPELISLLSTKPGKVRVSAITNDAEAYQFAVDWYDILKTSGWEMLDQRPLGFMIAGQPWTGVVVNMHGAPGIPGEQITISDTDPAAGLIKCLQKLNIEGLNGQRDPSQPDGTIILQIGPHPN